MRRESQNPEAQRAKKFQELGRKLVNDLYVYMRSLKLYKSDNKIFLRPLSHLENTINWLVAREGKVHLYGGSSTIYLNEVMIRFQLAALPNIDYLLGEFEKHDIGGILMERPVTMGQLQDFLTRFAKGETVAPTQDDVIQCESIQLARSRLQELSRAEVGRITSMKADVHKYSFLLYHRLFQFMKGAFENKEKPPAFNRAVRTLQEFIDLAGENDLQFLGITNELDPLVYEYHHVVNTAFLSIIFGVKLGLDRLQLLELGQAALRFNLGKMDVPEEVLKKRQPLTADDHKHIKMIVVNSVRRILKGPFSWSALRHAIVAGDIGRPYSKEQGKAPEQKGDPTKGPGLYARIISLCSCFDALCTRRPFRAKLFPHESILFMKEELKGQFDPYLLEKFVSLFGQMAISAMKVKRQSPSLVVPKEQRELKPAQISPLGQELQNELHEYWSLRRTMNRSPEQEHRLKFLDKFLKWKTGGHKRIAARA